MTRSLFGTRFAGILGGATGRISGQRRRPRPRFPLAVDPLENRALLATVTVHIVNFAFNPTPISINVGDTVHWVWDASFHTTTSVGGIAESWDSGLKNTGATFDHTFMHAG